MLVQKNSEKIILWMRRNNITIQHVATEIGITRQTFSKKLKDNIFDIKDLMALKRMGFNS
jgi:transcriptional regulator of acetoin/glycerol metabolism